MRKLVVYELLSLDGVAEQPDDFVTDFDDVMRENLGRVVATQEAVLLGRRTYDEWAAFWPTSDSEPFAGFINGVEKFVATATTPVRTWANTTRRGWSTNCGSLSPRPYTCTVESCSTGRCRGV